MNVPNANTLPDNVALSSSIDRSHPVGYGLIEVWVDGKVYGDVEADQLAVTVADLVAEAAEAEFQAELGDGLDYGTELYYASRWWYGG